MTQIYTQPYIASLNERPNTYERHQPRYYPHESTKSDGTLTHSERKGDKSWSPSHSPLSDVSRGSRTAEMYSTRPEATQNTSREQLPSLSSLFGSPSHQSGHQARPAHSPYSERQSPVFPSASPLDVRHLTTSTHTERPFSDGPSYFQRPVQQHTFHSRPDSRVERAAIAPPPPPSQTVNKPESPRYERLSIEKSRPQGPSVTAWSPRNQSSRPEYFSRDTSSSFRNHAESSHRSEELRTTYREVAHSVPATPSFPPTPASTVGGEVATSKDGLGPKIWTGTQFLPRFVRQAEVAGEGLCYFYDDGTHCKTVIDGEAVNAHWGVTKAGKPRKRLAIACITCREKKIKCDPDYPRCVQCEKFGRVCKFKNAPRGGQGTPDTPPADPEDVSRPPSSRADGESYKTVRENSPISPRNMLRQSPELEAHPSKRQRTAYSHFTPVPSEGSPRPSAREDEPDNASFASHDIYRQWQVNPANAHPAMVSDLIDVFFRHVPESVSNMFPQGVLRSWILSGGEKSLDDLMLIYSVLAISGVFSKRTDCKALYAQYISIARYACENRRYSIQLVQSRLLLSLYYFAVNNTNDAWDFCGSALRAASGLKLNIELENSNEAYLQSFPYGLTRHGYAECRRRTFWSSFLIERFTGFCSGHLSMLNPEDIFLRLPSDDRSYESQMDVQNPFYDISTPTVSNTNWTIGSMGYTINMITIWGDVMANINRSSQRQTSSNAPFGAFYETITRRLQAWHASLPKPFSFSSENVRRWTESNTLNTFITMHTLYHTTAMKLNRYVRLSNLNAAQHNHHVQAARYHAEALLSITDALVASRSSVPSSPVSHNHHAPNSRLSTPFVGYAIVAAIDILTTRLTLSEVPGRLANFSGAQSVLAELAMGWQSAKNQQASVLERVRDLAELTTQGTATSFRFGAFRKVEGRESIFEMRDGMEKMFGKDFDCIYG
ncbi:hypothetical protein HYALB_00005244 [Hymenoscyphus albidus]|uniref:Zn(2)-C6 fungal-type domain-containing protein n=1 Tax=Hymenoscyphus albidus TaxID=595503 RepID=A0A9N9LUR9_9HELO|nr:hypothetical protein HYALB_00005244 [Hymenoscyphus albidus]